MGTTTNHTVVWVEIAKRGAGYVARLVHAAGVVSVAEGRDRAAVLADVTRICRRPQDIPVRDV